MTRPNNLNDVIQKAKVVESGRKPGILPAPGPFLAQVVVVLNSSVGLTANLSSASSLSVAFRIPGKFV